jgi:hypothetical protein
MITGFLPGYERICVYLREYLDLRERKWQDAGEDCIMRSFITCMLQQVKEDETGGACSMHGEVRNAYKSLVEKPEGKISLGRLRCRWEDIRMNLKGVNWIHLAHDGNQWQALVNTVMNFQVP